jgi:hypothetical protein
MLWVKNQRRTMRLSIWIMVLVASLISLVCANALGETIISKQDADRIFSITKPEWEEYAQKIGYPSDWKIRNSNMNPSLIPHYAFLLIKLLGNIQ